MIILGILVQICCLLFVVCSFFLYSLFTYLLVFLLLQLCKIPHSGINKVPLLLLNIWMYL